MSVSVGVGVRVSVSVGCECERVCMFVLQRVCVVLCISASAFCVCHTMCLCNPLCLRERKLLF